MTYLNHLEALIDQCHLGHPQGCTTITSISFQNSFSTPKDPTIKQPLPASPRPPPAPGHRQPGISLSGNFIERKSDM